MGGEGGLFKIEIDAEAVLDASGEAIVSIPKAQIKEAKSELPCASPTKPQIDGKTPRDVEHPPPSPVFSLSVMGAPH